MTSARQNSVRCGPVVLVACPQAPPRRRVIVSPRVERYRDSVAATRVEPRGASNADPIFIAVGLLSAGSGTAKSANSSIGVWRRSQLRTSFAQYTGGDVALRFLLAPSSLIPASDPTAVDVTPALLREANAHRDMIFLNMTEGLYRCASWWRERHACHLGAPCSPPCLGLSLLALVGPYSGAIAVPHRVP